MLKRLKVVPPDSCKDSFCTTVHRLSDCTYNMKEILLFDFFTV